METVSIIVANHKLDEFKVKLHAEGFVDIKIKPCSVLNTTVMLDVDVSRRDAVTKVCVQFGINIKF